MMPEQVPRRFGGAHLFQNPSAFCRLCKVPREMHHMVQCSESVGAPASGSVVGAALPEQQIQTQGAGTAPASNSTTNSAPAKQFCSTTNVVCSSTGDAARLSAPRSTGDAAPCSTTSGKNSPVLLHHRAGSHPITPASALAKTTKNSPVLLHHRAGSHPITPASALAKTTPTSALAKSVQQVVSPWSTVSTASGCSELGSPVEYYDRGGGRGRGPSDGDGGKGPSPKVGGLDLSSPSEAGSSVGEAKHFLVTSQLDHVGEDKNNGDFCRARGDKKETARRGLVKQGVG